MLVAKQLPESRGGDVEALAPVAAYVGEGSSPNRWRILFFDENDSSGSVVQGSITLATLESSWGRAGERCG
jgi:hypothetical protein